MNKQFLALMTILIGNAATFAAGSQKPVNENSVLLKVTIPAEIKVSPSLCRNYEKIKIQQDHDSSTVSILSRESEDSNRLITLVNYVIPSAKNNIVRSAELDYEGGFFPSFDPCFLILK